MSKNLVACTLLFISVFVFLSCSSKKKDVAPVYNSDSVTLHGTSFLKGKISSIVYNDEQGYDSTLFVYNEKLHPEKVFFYSDGEMDGSCLYSYNGYDRIDLHYYDCTPKQTSYSIVEFDKKRNITFLRRYGYIYPDTANMQLLYMKQDSYNEDNKRDFAFEYHCDGIPLYKYRYSYDSDGCEIEECYLAISGDIYSVTKRKRDKIGNIIEERINYPWDNDEWEIMKIEYQYDDKGNWIERKIISDAEYLNRHTKRKIYYLNE
ncbi:MAG: hypothetical protein IJF46_02190 [Bacteroidaceae bacterium]|nr:hypothetical protein [Bacteroidaceae bacterium]